MIKIIAKRKDNEVIMKLKVTGPAADIVPEATSILFHMPQQLGEANPGLLKAVEEELAKKALEMFGDPDEAEEAETDDQ